MSAPDQFRDDLERLRRKKGWCPLTLEEADAELARAREEPLSDDEIDALIGSVRTGEVKQWSPQPDDGWTGDEDYDGVEEDVLQLNRNAGEGDDETDRLIDELRRKALDDDAEGQDRPDGGAAPPGVGG
jgi:hypothetical protein